MISHPDKVLFPDAGITKGELAAYYEAVAPLMLPHIAGRPLTMERYPSGIHAAGFFQKDVSKGFPEWLERVEVPKKGGTVNYPIVRDLRSLLWIANQNCITPHVWTSRLPDLHQPDLCMFDLDPMKREPAVLRDAAIALRDLLAALNLPAWIKTTGSKGFHIAVPLDGGADTGTVFRFAAEVARLLVARDPDRLTLEFAKSDRDGRILVDVGRNGFGATYAAPWAVRARPGAPVSVPCGWGEVESGAVLPDSFGLRDMERRIADAGDPWSDMAAQPQSLDAAIERLRALAHMPSSGRPRAT